MEGLLPGRSFLFVARPVVEGGKRVLANAPIHHPQAAERTARENTQKSRNVK